MTVMPVLMLVSVLLLLPMMMVSVLVMPMMMLRRRAHLPSRPIRLPTR